jgi:hypothetical protein
MSHQASDSSQDTHAQLVAPIGRQVRGLRATFAGAIKIAKDLFPGRVGIDQRSDPEFPQSRAIVVTVTASGDPAEIVRRRREWHKRTRNLGYDKYNLRLSIVPPT